MQNVLEVEPVEARNVSLNLSSKAALEVWKVSASYHISYLQFRNPKRRFKRAIELSLLYGPRVPISSDFLAQEFRRAHAPKKSAHP